MDPAQSIRQKTSETAAFTCLARARAHREKDERFRGPDHLARIFLSPRIRRVLLFRPLWRRLLRQASPGAYEYVTARTRFMDQLFVQALGEGFSQIVLLGAGYDTRAIRFRDQLGATRIFELDAPPTQNRKKECLARFRIAVPEELTFAAIDFNRQDIGEVLSAAGFERRQKTFFLWEGVTMYLPRETVESTLELVRSVSAPGSTIAFDYLYRSALDGTKEYYGWQAAAERDPSTSTDAEPLEFAIDEEEVEPFLAQRGFAVLAHHAPQDLETLYLTAPDGAFFGRVIGVHAIVHAEVKDRV